MITQWRVIIPLLIVSHSSLSQECVKDIAEDICPQREGFDEDCERRCLSLYPLRMNSGCYLRSTGTLLSFFGIRSFSCRCILPSSYCDKNAVLNALSPARLHFSLPAIQVHSTIERLYQNEICPLSPTPFDLSCSTSFSSCGWRRSEGSDWFSAKEHGIMPFSQQESPHGEYLVAVSKEGFTTISVDTCPQLCSQSDVNVTVRVWRAPWVVVEMCFKEEGAAMCAPLKTPNGKTTTEVVPQTNSFSISIRFSNLTGGDAILIDDLSTTYEPCPFTQKINAHSSSPSSSLLHQSSGSFHASMAPSPLSIHPSIPPSQPLPPAPAVMAPPPFIPIGTPQQIPSMLPPFIPPSPLPSVDSIATIPQRSQHNIILPQTKAKTAHTASAVKTTPIGNCKDGDCRSSSLDRTCVGRAASLKCQSKCRDEGTNGSNARCVRESEYPFTRRCVCTPRRSPTVSPPPTSTSPPSPSPSTSPLPPPSPSPPLIHHPSNLIASTTSSIIPHIPTSLSSSSSSSSIEEPLHSLADEDYHTGNSIEDLDSRRESLLEATVTCSTNDDCEDQCDSESTPLCHENECVCSRCDRHLCDFEKRGECGWSDLRVLSSQFNNISVAAKKGQDNRYGLSRMVPRSYSGLLRRAPITGPISLSVDLFPSHVMDVKICVHTLQTCQSQRVEARAWNRVTAKIRMKSTDKLFLLFYNKAAIDKTIAIDNIQLESGNCQTIPSKGVRRRVVV